jgi:hypothetical protein
MSMSPATVIVVLVTAREVPMSDDDPSEVIMSAIRSAFTSYPGESDPDWRSPSWIMPEECAHLTSVVIRELKANGFQIVRELQTKGLSSA